MLAPCKETGGYVILDSFCIRASIFFLPKPRSIVRASLSALVVLAMRCYPNNPLAVWVSTDEVPLWMSYGFEAVEQIRGLFAYTQQSSNVDGACQQQEKELEEDVATTGTQETVVESEDDSSDGESGSKRCISLGRCSLKVHKEVCPNNDAPPAGMCLRCEGGRRMASSDGLNSREADQGSLFALGPSALHFKKDELRLFKEKLGGNWSLAGDCVLKVSGAIAVHLDWS